MAKNQNITDQQELNRLTREYETMLNRVNSLRARIGQNPIRLLAPEETGNIQALTSAIKTLADESSALNEQLSEAKKSFEGLNDEIKEFGEHLEKQNKGIEDLVDSFKTVAEEIKTLTGDLSKIELPTLTQRIGYDLGDIPAAPLPELSTPIDKIVNIVVKGVEEAEATFSRLAEPFSRIVSIEQEVQAAAQEAPQQVSSTQETRIITYEVTDDQLRALHEELAKQLPELKGKSQEFVLAARSGMRDVAIGGVTLRDSFNELAGALSDAGTAADSAFGRSVKAGRQLRNITQELVNETEGYGELSLKDLESKQKQFEAQRGILDRTRDGLQREIALLEEKKSSEEGLNSIEQRRLDKLQDIANITKDSLKRVEDQLQIRIQQEKEINQLMGAGGALIKGASTLMSKLGISTQAFGDGLEKAQEKMREVAKEIQSGTRAGGRLTVLMSGLGGLASAFGTALTDPLTIITAILDGFLDVNKAAVELQRLTGTNESASAGVNSRLITSVEYLKTAAELTKEIGLAANAIFDSTQIAALSEAQKLLGLSAEQTANLGMRAKFVGDTVDGFQDSILAGADAANSMGRSAVAPGVVLQDVLNTSEDISLSLGQNPKALGKAAVAARAFGLSLEQVNNIADGLLDFESSIGAELEAQLLTGKNIQLSRARELALVNDLEGMSKELANQGVRAADFANMNRIQQESVAKALGMSREQLAKSLVAQAAQGELTEDQRAAVLGVSREQLAQLDVQQKLQDSLTKLAQAFTPMLDILIPFVELVGLVLTPIAKFVGWIMQGAKALGEMIPSFGKVGESANYLEKTLASISGILKSIPSLLAGAGLLSFGNMLRNFFSGKGFKFDLFKKVKEKIGGIKSGVTETATATGKDLAKRRSAVQRRKLGKAPKPATDVSREVSQVGQTAEPRQSGEGIKQFLTNLAEGLKAMGDGKVLFGAVNLVPASVGLVAMIPGFLGAKLLENIKGEKIKQSLEGLAQGISAFGSTEVTGGALNLIVASAGLVAMVPGFVGAKLLEKIDGETVKENLTELAEGISAFGTSRITGGALNLIVASAGLVAMIPGSIQGRILENMDGEKIKENLTELAEGISEFGTTEVTRGALNLIAASAGLVAMIPGSIQGKILEKLDGEAIKENLTELAEGISEFGNTKVTGGALNLIAASAGLVAMVPGFVGAKLLENIKGPKLQAGLTGLAAGLQSMNGTFVGSLALAAAGVGFAAFTLGAIGLGAVALLGAPAGAGLTALGGGLIAFARAMSVMTPLGPVILVAPAALALLGAALIPFAYALKIAAPAFVALGTAMKLAFEGIASVVTALFGGISQFLSVLTLEKAAALIAMGGAFVVLGGGLAALGASALLGVAGLGVLGAISLMGPGLATAATAVSSMAASVGELSRALREITPESVENLKKIMEAGMEVSTGNAIANVSEPIMKLVGVLGGGSDSGENNQGQLLAKLDELIRVVKEGGNVYMDGQRVGQSLVLGSSKLS